MVRLVLLLHVLIVFAVQAQQAGSSEAKAKPETGESAAAPPATVEQRTRLNLLGQTDARSGESRRNENVQFNLVDINVLKELNQRLGTTATIIVEFQPDRNYFSSEFGNAPAAALHLAPSTRQGTHGRLYESHLNSVFSARSFFRVGDVKPARENDYGAEILAPLWKRSSLSLQASQQKIRGMVNGNILVPLSEERTPLAADPATRAYVQRILASYPAELPNRPDIDKRMLNTDSPQHIDSDTLGGRLDQAVGKRDRLAFRYLLVIQKVDAFQFVAGQNPDTTTRSHQARITWSRQWTPSASLSVSLGFDRVGSLLVPEPNNLGPTFTIGGLTGPGPGQDIPIDRADNAFRQAVQIRRSRGAHTWTAGFELLRRQFNGLQSDSHLGSIRFNRDFGRDAITNLRLGLPSTIFISVGEVRRGFRGLDMAYYFGDKWQVGRNLAISYGLRYQPSPAPGEVNHRTTIPYGCDCNNLAPQFGLAYRLPGQWGVLRSAYGLQYAPILPVTYQQLRFNYPGNLKLVIQQPDLVNPLGVLAGTGLDQGVRKSLYILDSNLVVPYAHQYNFSWEPGLAGAWRLQLGYVGSRTTKLIQMLYTNRGRVVPGVELTTNNIDDRRPDGGLSEVKDITNTSRAWFDAARVTLLVPRWKGLSVDAAYWFSKAMDLGTNYTDTAAARTHPRGQSEFESHKDLKALSDFDQPHAFLARLAYDMPALKAEPRWLRALVGGWTLTSIALLKTGTPFTVESGSDAPGFGNVDGALGDRPNLLDPSILGRTIGRPDSSTSMLPKSAFAFIQPRQLAGSIGRNVFRKGPIRNVNAALARSFSLKREKLLRLRAESINFLNTAQFAAPGYSLTDQNFGAITNTLNDGRTFRFVASLEF